MKTIVIGGGAAGCMAAGAAARQGHAVTVVERNPRPARKVMITGKGRCNVTNNCDIDTFIRHVPENGRFLYSALNAFTPQDTMALFEEMGVPLKTERGNRVFPVSDKAVDIVDGLTKYAKTGGARFVQGRVTELIIEDGACRGVKLEDGSVLDADRVIVATGGRSYPVTGSTGDGYALAAPGELKGYFNAGKVGTLLGNSSCGVWGLFTDPPECQNELMPVGLREDLQEGDAYILCTLDTNKMEKYDVKISGIKQDAKGSKCFTVTVTDEDLIAASGGIVQGMSGSPIIQNGKIVGAVTHVLVGDPTTGYGIFLENMLVNMPLMARS